MLFNMRYMIIFIITLIISLESFKLFIPFLHKLKFGQVVREEGIEAHMKKSGTATMGGIVFIIVSVIVSSIYMIYNQTFISNFHILLCMLLFGIVGFADDYLKIIYKNPKGLNSKIKFVAQIVISLLFIYINYYSKLSNDTVDLRIPLTNNIIDLSKTFVSNLVFVIIMFLYITAVNNGVNFSDGLDGLCGTITVIVGIMFMMLSIKTLNANKADSMIVLNIAVIASLVGFLHYNRYPAKVFMGDTGSLFLGAYVAFMATVLDIQLYVFIFGVIYFIEVLSVIIQVTYFKKTGGKRFFKMAPIHHHFEKCGMSEKQIVSMFSFITLIACLITYRALVFR